MENKVFDIQRISSDGESFHYRAQINGNHPVFLGHFPQQPVVPGVCTLQMLKDCLSDILSRPIRYDFVKECKFLSAIIPGEHKSLDVNIHFKQGCNEVNVVAEVLAGESKMMKLKATLI